MGGDHLFHGAGGQAVAGHVDDVVHAAHDVYVAVLVPIAFITGEVEAGKLAEIGIQITLVIAPHRGQRARRQGRLSTTAPSWPGPYFPARLIENAQVVTRNRQGRRTRFGLGSNSTPAMLAQIDQPVSVCHQ